MRNTSKDIYPESKTVWKLILITSTHSKNSQELKCFFWHVSTLFKDLCLVVSIQTNHTYHVTSTQLRDYFFPIKAFSSLSPCWYFICGGKCWRPVILCTVQGYFWRAQHATCVRRPDHQGWISKETRWRFTTLSPQCRTAGPDTGLSIPT